MADSCGFLKSLQVWPELPISAAVVGPAAFLTLDSGVICHSDGERLLLETCIQKPNNLIKHIDRSEHAWLYFSTPSLSIRLMQALQALILDRVVLSSSLRPLGSASTVA